MNPQVFDDMLRSLPNAFPGFRVVIDEGLKLEWWKEFCDVDDADFIRAISELRRQEERFPSLGTVVRYLEAAKTSNARAELDRRMEEHYKKKQQPLSYAPADPGDKQLKIDTFAMIKAGVMSGDMPAALRKLGEKYPNEKWIPRLAEEMAREKVMGAVVEAIST